MNILKILKRFKKNCILFILEGCDHRLAYSYFIESISSSCRFRSYRCSDWDKFTRGNCMGCPGNNCPEMGYNADRYRSASGGNFYLYTNAQSPYCGTYLHFMFENISIRSVKSSYISFLLWFSSSQSKKIDISSFTVYQYAYITFMTKFLYGLNPKIRLYGTKGDTGTIELPK